MSTTDTDTATKTGTAATAALADAVHRALHTPGTPQPVTVAITAWKQPWVSRRTRQTTIGDLLRYLAEVPDHTPVLIRVPGWDCSDLLSPAVARWNGAMVLDTVRPGPPKEQRAFDFGTPAAPEAKAVNPRAAAVRAGALAAALAAWPDHAPVHAVINGRYGRSEERVTGVENDGGLVVLETDYDGQYEYDDADDDYDGED